MATRKRRKVEAEPPTQAAATPAMSAMSAFALRRKMLQQAQAHAIQREPVPMEVERAEEAADEESVAEDDEVEEVPPAAPTPTTPQREMPIQRTTFQPTKQNLKRAADGSVRLKIAEGEKLVILGSYGIVVHSGEATVAGAVLRASIKTAWVHAPQCHALPVVRCTDDAAVTLKPHPEATGLRKLEQVSPLFSQLWSEQADEKETFQLLLAPADAPKAQGLVLPPEWNKLLAELATVAMMGGKSLPPVYLVCGPKSSGKSTFARLLTNRLLTEEGGSGSGKKRRRAGGVAFLDIDPGQPEFGTPGLVSLVRVDEANLAPPFCHPRVAGGAGGQLLRAHDVAATSPGGDPEHYVACVLNLFQVYQTDARSSRYALVVNTPGWILGTGLDLLAELAERLRPSRVVYMSQDGPEETLQGLQAAYADMPLVQLPSQPSDSAGGRTAQQLRAMQTQSYLHLAPAAGWDPTPLEAVRPWVVSYSGSASGILGLVFYDAQPPPELLADAVNGTLVSMVVVERASAFRGSTLPPVARSPEGLPCLLNPDSAGLDPKHSHALGTALVRGIDAARKTLLLLTPVAMAEAVDEMTACQDGLGIVLVSGKLDQPTWAYTEELYRRQATVGSAEEQPAANYQERPWVEVLRGNEKRDVGSQVWRVRRDLGRRDCT